MTLRNQDTQSLTLRQKTVQRLAFVLNCIGNFNLSTVNLDLINVKIVLRRGGMERVLTHESLQILAMESMFFNGFEHALTKTGTALSNTYKVLPLMVDLGSPLNLKGDDELRVEVTTKVGWYGDFDAAASSLEVEERETIGVESVIPYIRSRAIQATISRDQFSLGDNVTLITLLNTESARTNSEADKVFDSIIIVSDKINWNDNRVRILGRRVQQFQTAAAAEARAENFVYDPKIELDGVQVTLGLNGANVAASKNYVVYRQFEIDAETYQRSVRMKAKHRTRNLSKLDQAVR